MAGAPIVVLLPLPLFSGALCSIVLPPNPVGETNKQGYADRQRGHDRKYLETQQKELAAVFRFTCKSDAENAVIIRLRNVPASHQRGDALGAARTENGKVIGQIEVFCDPVRRVMAMRWQSWPALEGWAMATVAAHEMYHYLNNEHDHGHGRLNQKIMNAEALARGFRTVPRMASRSE